MANFFAFFHIIAISFFTINKNNIEFAGYLFLIPSTLILYYFLRKTYLKAILALYTFIFILGYIGTKSVTISLFTALPLITIFNFLFLFSYILGFLRKKRFR